MRVKILSDQEYAALLNYLPKTSTRDNLIIRLALQCGLRAGEISALNIDNVWRQGMIHPAIHLPAPSTKGHIPRYVDIPAPVKTALDEHIAALLLLNYPCIPGAPLLVSDHGAARLTIRAIQYITARICTRAINRHINPHVLRHTYATMLLKYTNIRVVQTLLGHASIATTQIYTHPSSQECKNAVNAAFDN